MTMVADQNPVHWFCAKHGTLLVKKLATEKSKRPNEVYWNCEALTGEKGEFNGHEYDQKCGFRGWIDQAPLSWQRTTEEPLDFNFKEENPVRKIRRIGNDNEEFKALKDEVDLLQELWGLLSDVQAENKELKQGIVALEEKFESLIKPV